MKKSLTATYSDIRSAIAFIMRNERGLSKHTITEAALAATKVIHGKDKQMRQLTLTSAAGEVKNLSYCQFELNSNQQVAILPLDFDEMGGIVEKTDQPGVKSTTLGKLADQGFILQNGIRNSLALEGWDFGSCPNPEVVLLERQ